MIEAGGGHKALSLPKVSISRQVMDFISGGELFFHLASKAMFSEAIARFYGKHRCLPSRQRMGVVLCQVPRL